MDKMMIMLTVFMIGIANHGNVLAHWSDDGPSGNGLGKLAALDVICGKDHMTVRAEFAGPFHGIVFSKGTYGQDNCVYIKPYSGVTHATFKVYYNQCGTKPDLQGKYYENTVVIQYGTDIIEAWDEAKRLRCEWFEAYEKPATFRPAIPVADLDVVEMNFQGDDIDCWMEIQEGKGPWGREVSRIVPVGSPMTIVIAINDYGGEFDMRVKSCFAHDGVKQPIHLTDEHGCVLRPKMLTKFEKVKDPNGKATVISYAHFYAFKFPDSMNVQIQCTVEVCRHGCPDACQKTPYKHQPDRQFKQQISLSYGPNNDDNVNNQKPITQSASKAKEEEQIDQQDLQDSASHIVPSGDISVPPLRSTTSPPLPLLASALDANLPHHLLAQSFDLKRLPVYRDPEVQVEKNSSSNDNSSDEGGSVDEEVSSAFKGTESGQKNDQSTNNKQVTVPQTPHHPPTSSSNDDKPVFMPGNDPQEFLSNLGSDDYDKATRILKDLGVNVDMANIASGLIDGVDSNKNIASLLENEKVRELAEASGIKIKGQHHLLPEPLVSSNSNDAKLDNEANHPIEGDNNEQVVNNEQLTSPVPITSNSHSLPINKGKDQQQLNNQHKQVSTRSQVASTDQEKGQLSENKISKNVIQSHTDSVSDSSKPTMPVIRQQQQQDNQNIKISSHQQHQHHQQQQQQKHQYHHQQQSHHYNHRNQYYQQVNNHHNSLLSDSQANINHPYRSPKPGAASLSLDLENPVAQVVPLQLGIGPIGGQMNGFVTNTYNNKLPQPQGSQSPLVHHHQQKPKHHQRPMIMHDSLPPRPQFIKPQQQQQRPPTLPNHPLHRATSLLANLGHLPHFNLPFLATLQRQDNQARPNHIQSPAETSSVPFPHGPRSFRSKRSASKEPFVSVKKGFQVVTSIDLAFMPNTTDLPEIYEGRREEIVYGVCMPFNGLIVALSSITAIIIFSLFSSFILIKRLNKLRTEKTQIYS